MAARNPENEKELLAPRLSRGLFSSRFLDGLSERGTTRSIEFR